MAAPKVSPPAGFVVDNSPAPPAGFVLDDAQPLPGQGSFAGKLVQGLRDPIDAGAQLLSHVVPEGVSSALDYLPSKMRNSDSPLLQTVGESLFADPRATATDKRLQDTERQYQKARTEAQPQTLSGLVTGKKESPGIDWTRLAGNVLSPANLAIGANVPVATSTAGKLAVSAATGAGFGALSPVNDGGDFSTEKAKQVAMGTVLGPATQVAGNAAARIISPQTRDAVTKLMEEGITPTPGQILGGRWQVAEDKLQSVPLLGDAIASSRKKGIDELNLAVYKRALDPIGGTVPKEAGRDAVASVRQQISDAYDNLLPKVQFKADPQFATDLQTLQQMASNLPPDQEARFAKILKDNVIGKMTPQGSMDGETLKGIESQLGQLSSGLKSDAQFDNRQLGAAIGEVQAAIRSNLERSNPQYADQLKAANTAWATYTRIRDAAARQGADEGKFTPAQLSAAVRAQDKTRGKKNFSEGDALLQDLSDPAKSVLAPKYPDSGTAGRTLLGLGVGGGAAWLSPEMATTMTAGIVPYLPGGRQAAAALLAKRPQGAEGVADAVRRLAPAASPALIGILK